MSEKPLSWVTSRLGLRSATTAVPTEPVTRLPTRPSGRPAVRLPTGPCTRPLLAAKLRVAPLPKGIIVSRDRLWARLDAGTRGPITLVSAPAGWGKTVLLASWCRSGRPINGGSPAAWLTIEPGDHGAWCWPYLVAALRRPAATADPVVTADPAVWAAGDGAGPDRRVREELAAELADRSEPIVLIVDDAHRAGDPSLVADLDYLARHAEGNLRLVISARTDPMITLHRWRLSGDLTEIRATELAFTDEEIAELLVAHGIRLPPEQVAALRTGTEGWAAGLRFAALALRGHPEPERLIATFGGDSPTVADYLTGEVLLALPGQAQEALVRAAVTEQICGGLLDALTGRADGEHLLAEAARTTGFVLPVDDRPDHYRCHPMLRDLLRARLRERPRDERLDLHRRAAQWYARHDRPMPALRHALTAGDDQFARGLLRDHWADLVPYCPPATSQSSLPSLASPPSRGVSPSWPASPPPHELAADPELALAYAVERLNRSDPAAADYLRVATGHAHRIGDGRRDWFAAVCAGLRLACHQMVEGRMGKPIGGSNQGPVNQRPVNHGPADHGPAELRTDTDRLLALAGTVPYAAAIARAVRGASRLADGDLAGAERELAEGFVLTRRAGPRRAAQACAERLALTYALQGRLRAAADAARWSLDAASGQAVDHPADLGHAYLAQAAVALHRDRPDEAQANLCLAEQRLDTVRDPVLGVVVAVLRAQLRHDRGDLLGAGEDLAQARRHAVGRPPGWPPADWLLVAEAELRTALGDPAAARDLLREAAARKPAPWPAEAAPLAVALARVTLAAGDAREAERLLARVATPAWPLASQVEAGLLTALAARAVGDERGAARRLEEMLGLAEPEGFRRVFTRAGPPARELLAAHLDSGTAYWSLVAGLLAESDARTVAMSGGRGAYPSGRSATAAAGHAGAGVAAPLPEPLTERELTILRYLQSILSNVEIAAELSLSVNTVKTHVRNIYRKLDASRRREAVRRARELHLI